MSKLVRYRNLTIRASLVLIVLLTLAAAGSAPASATPTDTFTLSGKVTYLDGTTPVPDATVLAIQAGQPNQHANTDLSGDYSISLPGAGDWQVNVLPHESVPTHSPDWVYTGGVTTQAIVADPGNSPLDFMVTLATATVTGQLLTPVTTPPGTDFSSPNTAAVRVANQEGQGNTVQVAADGTFSINVLPGDIVLHIALHNALWAPDPTLAGSVWTVSSGTFPIPTTPNNPLQLLEKQATITGTVLDDQGHPALGIPVRAWRLDASEAANTTSSMTDGAYTLHVINGIWEIWAVPSLDQPFVSDDSPKTVILASPTDSKVQDLNVISADITVTGQVVDQNNIPISPAPNGHVIPTYLDKDGIHWRQFAQGARIVNGLYTLKLSSAESMHYRLHAAFPNLQGYSEIYAPLLDLVDGQTTYTDVNLPVGADNSSISGHLVDQSQAPKTGLAGAIYGASDGGAFALRRVNPVDASYSFSVAASDKNGNGGTFWWLHAFVDPSSTYVVAPPHTKKVFLPDNNGAGANVTGVDFTVVQLNATLKGLVTDPDGVAVPFAKVGVLEQDQPAGSAFNRWVLTDMNGKYNLAVPAGSYKVRADHLKWISPIPISVTITSTQTLTENLQFRLFDAWITGSVTYSGSPHTAFVRAWTADGAHTWAYAVLNTITGKYVYALHVNSGDLWHVQAVSEDGSAFLRSSVLGITPTPGFNTGNDLALNPVDALTGAVVFSFDPTQDQTLTLSDGAQVIIPANAMAITGTVTVIVRPLPELANDGVTAPVSFGYRLLAYDNFGTPIEAFNSPVTLVMPFTAAQLAALGVTPADLIPSYWDLGTNSFKPVNNYAVTQNSDGSGSLNLQVNHFTDYAVMYGTNPAFIQFKIYLPTLER